MLKVGLTGGMACGKSVVAKMFAARGAHVIQADQVAHDLIRPGQPVYEEVVRHFGRQILASDGTIDRRKLADAAFTSDEQGRTRVEELNGIVHPAVVAAQSAWAEEIGRREPDAVTIVEAALIFEAGARERFDRIVVVQCDAEQKVERFAQRAGVDLETARREVERRSAAQWADERKVQAADYVIRNAGSLEETEKQVENVFAELKREAVAQGQR